MRLIRFCPARCVQNQQKDDDAIRFSSTCPSVDVVNELFLIFSPVASSAQSNHSNSHPTNQARPDCPGLLVDGQLTHRRYRCHVYNVLLVWIPLKTDLRLEGGLKLAWIQSDAICWRVKKPPNSIGAAVPADRYSLDTPDRSNVSRR